MTTLALLATLAMTEIISLLWKTQNWKKPENMTLDISSKQKTKSIITNKKCEIFH